ncbi:unnamed protein product [Effrenium voratum]|uniref:EF-hand domain-containing protein n=1 Tax=Effrenium voratum TaxID=2562239 RepID=A0AA36I234_9DINO|nr:unnamed protein product [Effrenium voratum]CAJ1378817.1 unnamed protein product [Effrenium voratum]CAJ1460990.1 unnamed protein product [Effrenium voratum]
MGNAGSVRRSKPVMSYLVSEFNRLKSHGVDGEAVWGQWFAASVASSNINGASLPQAYTHVEEPVLTLASLQKLNTPEDFLLDFRHIATLWKLDANHDGVITFEEFINFAEFCNDQRMILGDLELSQKLKALCVMDMAADTYCETGQNFFVDWLLKLVAQDMSPRPFRMMRIPVNPDDHVGRPTFFVHMDCVMNLYNLLKPSQISSHLGMQDFVDLLHQMGETMNLQPLMIKDLDEWVPLEVVHTWLKRFISAFTELYKELGLLAEA